MILHPSPSHLVKGTSFVIFSNDCSNIFSILTGLILLYLTLAFNQISKDLKVFAYINVAPVEWHYTRFIFIGNKIGKQPISKRQIIRKPFFKKTPGENILFAYFASKHLHRATRNLF